MTLYYNHILDSNTVLSFLGYCEKCRAKEPLNNKLYNLGNVAQPGAAVPHIKLVNVIYFQALTIPLGLVVGQQAQFIQPGLHPLERIARRRFGVSHQPVHFLGENFGRLVPIGNPRSGFCA